VPYGALIVLSSVEKVGDELLELIEVNLAAAHRIHILERQLQLLLVHVLGLAQELVEFVE